MNCKNCGNELLTKSKFCNQCGSKIITKRLHLKDILSEWFSTILNIDNKFISTFLHLFSKPQNVTIGYIEGLRKKYMSPINYLLLAFGLYGFYLLIFDGSRMYHDEFLMGFYGYDGEAMEEDKLHRLKILNLPISFLQILIFAYTHKVVFGKKYNYAEYLIITSYWFGQLIMSSVIIIFIIDLFKIEIESYLPTIIITSLLLFYTLYVEKSIFQHSWIKHFLLLIGFLFLSLSLYFIYIITVGYFI